MCSLFFKIPTDGLSAALQDNLFQSIVITSGRLFFMSKLISLSAVKAYYYLSYPQWTWKIVYSVPLCSYFLSCPASRLGCSQQPQLLVFFHYKSCLNHYLWWFLLMYSLFIVDNPLTWEFWYKIIYSILAKSILKPATVEWLFTYYMCYNTLFYTPVAWSFSFWWDIEDLCSPWYPLQPPDFFLFFF